MTVTPTQPEGKARLRRDQITSRPPLSKWPLSPLDALGWVGVSGPRGAVKWQSPTPRALLLSWIGCFTLSLPPIQNPDGSATFLRRKGLALMHMWAHTCTHSLSDTYLTFRPSPTHPRTSPSCSLAPRPL